MQICDFACFDPGFLPKKQPEESASHRLEKPKPQHTSSGPRGEVQWLSGSSETFEIRSGLKFFVILKNRKSPPKLLNTTPRQHAGTRDLKANETREDRLEHGDFEYRIGGFRSVRFPHEKTVKTIKNHKFSSKNLDFRRPLILDE